MKNYIVCLKHGKKYSEEYVNKLYNMVNRNTTVDYEFVCITENSVGLNSNIRVLPLNLETDISGWWYKPMIFNPDLGLEGNILFLDLDVIIFDNIDKLFSYETDKFCIIKDYYLKRKGKEGMNSSCFRFKSGTNSHVYTDFKKNSQSIMKRLAGDQDWIQEVITENFSYWETDWVMSYKWEMCNEKNIKKVTENKYSVKEDPRTPEGSCVAVFHGNPNPHEISNEWCQRHWR